MVGFVGSQGIWPRLARDPMGKVIFSATHINVKGSASALFADSMERRIAGEMNSLAGVDANTQITVGTSRTT
jgi:hypothetical protein